MRSWWIKKSSVKPAWPFAEMRVAVDARLHRKPSQTRVLVLFFLGALCTHLSAPPFLPQRVHVSIFYHSFVTR